MAVDDGPDPVDLAWTVPDVVSKRYGSEPQRPPRRSLPDRAMRRRHATAADKGPMIDDRHHRKGMPGDAAKAVLSLHHAICKE